MLQVWPGIGPLETVLFAIMAISALGAVVLTLVVHFSVKKSNARKREQKNARRDHQRDGLIASH